MTRVYLGLGGNLGEPRRQMAEALRAFDAEAGHRVVAVSPIYRTPPWGKTDQPDFLNACASIDTDRAPTAFLELCLDIERRLHREREERWGPRTIDIDILDFGGQILRFDILTVPHPRMQDRAFVMIPLAEIAPELVVHGRQVRQWADMLDREGIRLATADPGWWKV